MNIEKLSGGIASFENHWGEEILMANLQHTSIRLASISLVGIQNNELIENAFEYIIQHDVGQTSDYWRVHIVTLSGSYTTPDGFFCSIGEEDKKIGRVKLSVDGKNKQLNVTYPVSGTFSTKMSMYY